MTAPEYRTQVKRWFVEIGVCDGGGIGHWVETEESVEVSGETEASALRDSWLASGKLQTMRWGELRPKNPYGIFGIRQVWEDAPTPLAEALAVPEIKALVYAAKMVMHDLHHGNGFEGLYENRDRLDAALRAIGGDA